MVNVPLKKKWQVSSPGRVTPAPKYKKRGRGTFSALKNFPPNSKEQGLRDSRFLLPQATFGCILLSFLVLLLTPTSKYLILEFSSFPLVHLVHLLVL